MKSRSWDVAWYRFRATLSRRRGAYLSVILLIGLTGGLAMGSLTAARRTQSSFPTFLARTNPSTLSMAVYNQIGAPGASIATAIAHLADVAHVRTLNAGAAVPLNAKGAPRLNTVNLVVVTGSTDGDLTQQDRLAVLSGHLANPSHINQIDMTPAAERIWGVRLGHSVRIGFYAPAQTSLPGFGTAKVKPRFFVDAHVVGIVAQSSEIVQDDVDRAYGFVFISPTLMKKAAAIDPSWSLPVEYEIQLRDGDAHLGRMEQKLSALVPVGFTYEFHVTSHVLSTVELALKPESVALGAFGVIAALVCLLLSMQSISRLVRRDVNDRRNLRALGASPREILMETLVGVIASVVVGILLALVVALALSPLAPLGPVRPVYPDRGFSFDASVLVGGAVVLLVILLGFAVASALVSAEHRDRGVNLRRTPSVTVRHIRSLSLPTAATLGAHFALEPRGSSDDVPVRSVLFGSIVAVALLATTLTFASGLNTLVSRPALYGWNWSYALNPTNAVPPSAITRLDHDHDVAAWSGVDYTDVTIDGQSVPVLIASPKAKVMPPILTGHGLDTNSQVVLGNQTLAQLHRRIGQTVSVSYGTPADKPLYVAPTTLTIVGTATFPAVGYATSVADHTSMGTGALLPLGVETKSFMRAISSKDPNLNGPAMVFVRLRSGVSASAGRANLERVAAVANATFAHDPNGTGNYVTVLSVQRPAQIVDYRSIGTTPVLLAALLAAGAVGALAVTLITSVRHRRRDLAILKTLGLTRRTAASAIIYQASVDAIVGVIVGIPLGILLGRELWTLFARDINAVPYPTVPVGALVLVGVGTIVVAILTATWPGRSAARTSPGLTFRSE
ncbi:MAG: FtsX-like permease family protein [Acidimicrobiales bacterium]